jgi:hypothetical protein
VAIAYEFMSAVDPHSGRFIQTYLENQVVPPTLALGEVVLLTADGENYATRYYQGVDGRSGEPYFSSLVTGGGIIFKLTRAAPARGADSGYAQRVARDYGV